jgi:hypothetical protein
MNRPLLISDCDEVLLHMVRHFRDWLDDHHGIDFAFQHREFTDAMRHRATGDAVEQQQMWELLNSFFDSEMARQTLAPHVINAFDAIDEIANIVILTNLLDRHREGRIEQLERHGIRHRVICNQGGKGAAVAQLIDEYGPSATVFVDDIPIHHESVAKHAPDVWRVHMIAEPEMAATREKAPAAHVRIDDWQQALPWILDRFDGKPA